MTSLLDILREIEPDAGWEAVPCVEYVRSPSAEAYLHRDRTLRTWCAVLVNPDCYTRVEALHDDARTAVRMALAGYRAKEKT